MCFSAEASFIASGTLAASSVAIARIPKERSSVPLSLFPAIFSAHQFIEGVLWLNQDGVLPDATKTVAVYAFAFIAYAWWPMFVPLAAGLLETDRRRRALIWVCQAVGLAVGLSLVVSFVRHPIDVQATCCGLYYSVNAPDMLIVPYLFAVSIPFLASSRGSLVLFGVAVLTSCAAAAYLATVQSFPSVWCFFAAAMSGGLYVYFRCEAREGEPRLEAGAMAGAPGRP